MCQKCTAGPGLLSSLITERRCLALDIPEAAAAELMERWIDEEMDE
jgi:hypothetical protein